MFSVACIAITALIVTATGYSGSGASAQLSVANSTTRVTVLSSAGADSNTTSAISVPATAPPHALTTHRIVCVGDSVTAGFSDPDNWPYHLKSRLGGDWEVVNQGIGGDKTADMLNRIDAALELNPGFVVVMGGINDLAKGKSLDSIEGNIDVMCARVASHGAAPVLCTVTPTGDYPQQKDDLNTWITEYAHTKGYALIDFYTLLNDISNPGHPDPALVYDGTHPNRTGHVAMADAIDLGIFTG